MKKKHIIHFEIDYESTACGLSALYFDCTENIAEVTCKNCHARWEAMKKAWMDDSPEEYPDIWPDVPKYRSVDEEEEDEEEEE